MTVQDHAMTMLPGLLNIYIQYITIHLGKGGDFSSHSSTRAKQH